MKLSVWAKKQGITYRGAWGLFNAGKIPGAYQLQSGTIIINDEKQLKKNKEEYIVVYCRVSSSQNKDNLQLQAERLINFCAAKGWKVQQVIKEIGSGLNDNRPKLISIFKKNKATKIVIEHKDRLTRFGFNYIKELFDGQIYVINEVENNKQDLIQDFISIITSFCARIYGQRRTKRNTEKLINELNKDKE